MQFAFTEEQEELRAVVRAFLAQRARSEQVRSGWQPATWSQLIEQMELTAIALPEAAGGAGASFVEVGIALEEIGRALLPAPYLPTVVGATALAAAPELQARVVAGDAVALALDVRDPLEPVAVAARARRRRRRRQPAAARRRRPAGARRRARAAVRRRRARRRRRASPVRGRGGGARGESGRTADRRRDARPGGAPPERRARRRGSPRPARARRRWRGWCETLWVAQAVEAVGLGDRALSETVAYLKERVQFGRVLGSFQALRHRCADLAAELEGARATAHYAAWAVDGAPEELAVTAPLAKAVCAQAAYRVAAEAIQLHGGIGFTWEHDAHLWFKRAKATEQLYGTPRRAAAAGGAARGRAAGGCRGALRPPRAPAPPAPGGRRRSSRRRGRRCRTPRWGGTTRRSARGRRG